MQQRLEVLQCSTSETASQQQQPEIITAAFHEITNALEELEIANEELHQQNQQLCRQNEELSVARLALVAERQRYQELFEFAPDAYLLTDNDGVIQEANCAAATLLNVSQKFLAGKPLLVYVVEKEHEEFYSKLALMLQAQGVEEWEGCLQPRNSVPINAALKVSAVKNQEGRAIALRWLIRDLTASKQAQELIARGAAEIEISQIFNMLPSFVWKFCPSTAQFIYASEIMTELSGIPREEFLHNHQIWDERVDSGHESQESLRLAGEAITKGEPYTVVYLFHTLHRGSRWFEVTARPAIEDGVLYYYGCTADITSRKQAEEELSKERSLLRTVVTNAPIILYALDSQGVFTLSEGKGLERLGRKPNQAVGQSIFDLYSHSPDILENIRRTLAGAENEWLAELADAVYENRVTPLRDEQGNVIGMIAVATDITQRQQALSALQASEAKNRALLAALPDLMFRLNREGIYLDYKAAKDEDLFLPTPEIIGSKVSQILPEEVAEQALHYIEQALRTNKIQIFEYQLQLNGSDRDFEARIVKSAEAEVVVIVRDISSRKQAEKEIHFQAHLLNLVQQAIITTDINGNITYWNRFASTLYGWKKEEALGRNILEIMLPTSSSGEQGADKLARLRLGESTSGEYILQRRDGTTFNAISAASPIFDERGVLRGIVGVSADITPLKHAEILLQQANQELETRVTERTFAYSQLNYQLVLEIAERQQTEEALRRSEAKFQKLTANVPGMIYQFLLRSDRSFAFPFVSASCREIYELEPEEIQHNAAVIIECIHPSDRQSFDEALAVSATTLQPWQWEGRVLTRSGNVKWLQGISRPEKQENGDILWDGLLIDISDRKQAEAALQKSEERLRLAVEAGPFGTWDWQLLTGEITWCPTQEKFFGLEVGTYDGTYETLLAIIHPDDREFVTQGINRILYESENCDIEYRIIWPDGSVRWIASKGQVFYDETGKPVRMLGINQDITERKQAQEALRKSEATNRVLLETIPDLIIRMSGDGIYFDFIPARNFKYVKTCRDMRGQNIYDILPLEVAEQRMHYVQQALSTGKVQIYEFQILVEDEILTQEARIALSGENEVLVMVRDISERKRAEAALQESNERLRVALEAARMGSWDWNIQTGKETWSPNLAALFGLEVGTFDDLHETFLARVHPDDREFVVKAQEQAIAQREGYDIEFRIVWPDGTLRWLASKGQVFYDETGQPERMAGLNLDISDAVAAATQRKQSEETLQRQLAAVEAAQEGIAILDRHGKYIYLNSSHLNLYGYNSTGEILGHLWQELYYPEEVARFERDIFPILYQNGSWRGEATGKKLDGTTFPQELSLTLIEDGGLICVCRDISDRQAREEALRHSEERFRNLIETTSDWVWEVDEKAVYTYASCKVRDILGYEPSEILGKTPFDLMPPEEAFRVGNIFGPIAAKALPFSCLENTNLHKNGYWVVLESSGVPVFDSDGKFSGYRGMDRDITSRKQAESVLRESEERFRAIFEKEAIGASLTSLEGRILATNAKFRELLGYSEEELHGILFNELTHPDDVRPDWELYQELVAGTRDSYQLEKRYIRKDGQVAWGFMTVALIRGAGGVPQFSTATIHDITQRKQIEEALRESEERFRQLAENIREVFWMISPDANQMLYISPAYEEVWGRTCLSLYQQPSSWLEAIHPDDRDLMVATLDKLYSEGGEQEYRIVWPDGTIRWIRDRAFPVRNSAGHIYRIAGVAEDITERKRTEEEVRFLQSMTQAIFDSSDFHAALRVALEKVCEATGWDFGEAWIPGEDGTALKCSPAWYNRDANLAQFRNLSENLIFPPGIGIPGRVWISKEPEWRRDVSLEPTEVYFRAQHAKEFGLKSALGIPIVANDQVLAVLVFFMYEARDKDERLMELISASTELGLFMQRKRAEEEVRNALAKEKELNELKSRFISMTSHEFRTPLSTILFSAGLLETYGYKWADEKKITHLQRIQNAVHRMTRMLDDVLLIGKAEAGKLEFHPAPLDLESFCQELVGEMQLTAGSKYAIAFVAKGECPQACMDEKLLHHILTNLLSNAIKYSPNGGRIECELSCEKNKAIFRIKDQGIGIPAEDQPRLFETFHRATNVGTIPGTGLGLAIIKNFIDLHGGEIMLESRVGVGTTFIVNLPLHPQA
jgi:PAS domain S-box-containing protein